MARILEELIELKTERRADEEIAIAAGEGDLLEFSCIWQSALQRLLSLSQSVSPECPCHSGIWNLESGKIPESKCICISHYLALRFAKCPPN
jgi:nitrite reductase/ring-hydroxylating ferredoxin subunit